MALINCNECGQEISDKASVCPHCGIKIKHKKKSINIILYTIISAVCLIMVIAITNIYKSTSYPKIIGSISLNMKQEEVERILLGEIKRDLYYSNFNFESDGVEIFVCDSIEGNSLSDMSFSKGHPNIVGISFYFDADNKLCQITIHTTDISFKSICKEYGIDINNITYFYGGAWTKGYIVNDNMYTQVSVVEDVDSNSGAII